MHPEEQERRGWSAAMTAIMVVEQHNIANGPFILFANPM
jgi:hypothetical protein